ncbi:hypothetical protein Tco_0525028 [Tanacetum coccineum]
MATMEENVIVVGFENRPPMLEKGMYDSWKTQILLYIRGKENGEMLIDSIKKAVNIILLGLPVDIYTLMNHYQTAKEILDRVKELMECTEMTKHERASMLYDEFDNASMLYDEFDKLTSEPRESIHSYYLRYAKLINDMNMIPMSMSNMQINTKFVNHLQPEWSSGEGHIAKQCTAKKRVKDFEWFKDKMLLARAQEAGVVLHEEQQDFLADRLEDNDDYCDDQATATAIFMASLSSAGSLNDDTFTSTYDSNTLSETEYNEHSISHDDSYVELTSDSNVISYAEYMVTIQDEADHYVPPPI